jgi:hypothetical protein
MITAASLTRSLRPSRGQVLACTPAAQQLSSTTTKESDMKSTTNAAPANLADPTPGRNDLNGTTPAAILSLPRLYLLRVGYLVLAVGLTAAKWPEIISHDGPWPLFEGVETCMLVALSLLFFLGLRYPIKMLPILLFEIGWKFIWVTVVVAPLWVNDLLDQATAEIFYFCLVVLIVVAVVPWRYVITHYITKHGDPWRPDATRPVANQL